MRISIATALVIASVSLIPQGARAAASSYLCAIQEVNECHAVGGCKEIDNDAINLSDFITLDLDKKQLTSAGVSGPTRTEDIEGITITDKAIFLYGTQDQESWNTTITLETGDLVGGIASGTSSFAIFGACTPK
jgi:hypothetical protein